MDCKRIIIILNILVIIVMCIHIAVKMYSHANHIEYSAPAYVNLYIAIYYIIAIVILNLIYFFLKK